MSSQRKRSALWNHFTLIEPKKAKCAYCANTLSIPTGNVGNLGRHMKTKHPTVALVPERQQPSDIVGGRIPEEESVGSSMPASSAAAPPPTLFAHPNPTQPSIRDFAESTKPMPPRRSEKLDEQLMLMIAKGYYPFRMVEDKEFKKFLSMLFKIQDSRYIYLHKHRLVTFILCIG
ncbi:unnamed protein product [Plutella xylostella]|uniref:(diamondback moth) hypothetical protein n=1 Tax=Plutella xylostella TaxID=51655 RepID=A0A8S4FNH9_PLUXY|nr:unnamed protein product [Plutella xylostella]